MRGLTKAERSILSDRGDHFDVETFRELERRGLVVVIEEFADGVDTVHGYCPTADGKLALRLDALAREMVPA